MIGCARAREQSYVSRQRLKRSHKFLRHLHTRRAALRVTEQRPQHLNPALASSRGQLTRHEGPISTALAARIPLPPLTRARHGERGTGPSAWWASRAVRELGSRSSAVDGLVRPVMLKSSKDTRAREVTGSISMEDGTRPRRRAGRDGPWPSRETCFVRTLGLWGCTLQTNPQARLRGFRHAIGPLGS